jgi:hypothetical protein
MNSGGMVMKFCLQTQQPLLHLFYCCFLQTMSVSTLCAGNISGRIIYLSVSISGDTCSGGQVEQNGTMPHFVFFH